MSNKNNYKSEKKIRNQSYIFSLHLNVTDRDNNEIDLSKPYDFIDILINDGIVSKLTIPLYIKKSVYESDENARGFMKIGKLKSCKYDDDKNDIYFDVVIFGNYTEHIDDIINEYCKDDKYVFFVNPEIIINRYTSEFDGFNKFVLEPILRSVVEEEENNNSWLTSNKYSDDPE